MGRQVFSKKDRYEELKELEKAESDAVVGNKVVDAVQFDLMIRERAGGSISAVQPNNTEHGKWLTAIQDKNPFVGKKYMMRAVEYETDSKATDTDKQEVVDADDVLINKLDAGLGAYDPNSTYGEMAEERKEKRDSGNVEKKVIDHCIAMNITRKLIGRTDVDMRDIINDELCEYHGDHEYKTDIDIEASIEFAKTTMLLSDDSKKSRLLK